MEFNLFLKRTKSPKAIGIFFIIFGIGWFITSISILSYNEIFKMNSIKTVGTVIDNIQSLDSDGNISYHTKYSYSDSVGKNHEIVSNSSSNPPEYNIGTKIEVYYNRINVENSIYNSSTINTIIIIFCTLGLLITGIGIYLFIKNKNSKIHWE